MLNWETEVCWKSTDALIRKSAVVAASAWQARIDLREAVLRTRADLDESYLLLRKFGFPEPR